MQKINFQDLPNTTTPISASNLNQVQTNVENAIDELNTPTITTSGNITYIKYGNIVIMNGKLPSNTQSGTVTLLYTSKYKFGFGFVGYYPPNSNIQAYGFAVVEANSKTLTYNASAAFTDGPISAIYYTED